MGTLRGPLPLLGHYTVIEASTDGAQLTKSVVPELPVAFDPLVTARLAVCVLAVAFCRIMLASVPAMRPVPPVLNARLVEAGVPHRLALPVARIRVMTRSAGPPFRPVSAVHFRATLPRARLPPLSMANGPELLKDELLMLVRCVALVTPRVLSPARRLTHMAPEDRLAVAHRPMHFRPLLLQPSIALATFGNAWHEPLPKHAPRSMFLPMVVSNVNGPTAELILHAVRAMPPSRPARQLLFVHSETTELLPGPIDSVLNRTLLGMTFRTLPREGSTAENTRLRPDPLTAAMTPQLLALRLRPSNVPAPMSLPRITASRHLPGLDTRPPRRTLTARGNPVVPPLLGATQLLLLTTPSMCPQCPLVRPGPMLGAYMSGVGTTLVSTVVLESARLPVLPLKHVPVVVRTLHVLWLRQTAPTQPYNIRSPLRVRVTPIVRNVLCSPFMHEAALFRQQCLVHRRATAELFRSSLAARPPQNVCVTLTGLTFPPAQKEWLLEVITVPLMQLGRLV